VYNNFYITFIKMPPPSADKGIRKPPARPLKARSKRAPKSQADAPKSQADAPKSQADAPKSQADAPKSQADAPKSQAEGTYNDSDENIGSGDEIGYDSGEDSDIITNEVADWAKYKLHSGQFFRSKRWACPECIRLSNLIRQYTIERCNPELILIFKKQIRKHLIKSSKFRVAI